MSDDWHGIAVMAKAVNAIYYREFSEEVARDLVAVYNNLGPNEFSQDFPNFEDILMLPYRLAREIGAYYGDSETLTSPENERQIEKIGRLCDLISQQIHRRMIGDYSSQITWEAPGNA